MDVTQYLLAPSYSPLSFLSSFFNPTKPSCRYLPGDAGWPTLQDWADLNSTVGGRLIATTPLGAPCHHPTYDVAECDLLRENWAWPHLHTFSPSSVSPPASQNGSCDPFSSPSTPCLLGNYVDYSINVSSAMDVAAGVKFAQDKNIRIVIKNTGHDNFGRSTGKGALGLWTHNMKSIDFFNYAGPGYTGPAVKLGAGVEAHEAWEAGDAHGVRILGGDCPTVGLTGGYTQGGGHGQLASLYGLSADQVLEWEVVTANGKHLVATPRQNEDLYWALSGGGPGNYGVVISMTVKVHPDGVIGGASLSFSSGNISPDTYWEVIELFHAALPSLVDTGATFVTLITNESFYLDPLTAPTKTEAEVHSRLSYFTNALTERNIQYNLTVTSLPRFSDHFWFHSGPKPYGRYRAASIMGGRLLPRSVIEDNNSQVTTAFRTIAQGGKFLLMNVAANVAHSVAGNAPGDNAVLPAWRDSLIQVALVARWDFGKPLASNLAIRDEMANVMVPMLERLAPDSGTYMNEVGFGRETWKKDFYGANYERLATIKKKYDPHGLFYAATAVGSDAWEVASDGRLCRTAAMPRQRKTEL